MMIETISAASASNTSPTLRANPAMLEAQLQKYEKTLSECVNCATAKTPEGKKNIEDISRKMDNVKARIAALTQARDQRTEATHAFGQQNVQQTSGMMQSSRFGDLSLGQHINVFA